LLIAYRTIAERGDRHLTKLLELEHVFAVLPALERRKTMVAQSIRMDIGRSDSMA
jgi:hypothetical protein